MQPEHIYPPRSNMSLGAKFTFRNCTPCTSKCTLWNVNFLMNKLFYPYIAMCMTQQSNVNIKERMTHTSKVSVTLWKSFPIDVSSLIGLSFSKTKDNPKNLLFVEILLWNVFDSRHQRQVRIHWNEIMRFIWQSFGLLHLFYILCWWTCLPNKQKTGFRYHFSEMHLLLESRTSAMRSLSVI